MSRPTAGRGPGAIGSSIWSTPASQSQPSQSLVAQPPNVAMPTRVPPHLQANVSQAAGVVEVKKPAGFVPPHLRGFNFPAPKKENAALKGSLPPHLQPKFASSVKVDKVKQESSAPVNKPAAQTPVKLTNEEAFEEMIMKQNKDAEAKRKSHAEKALLTPTITLPSRSKFQPTEESDQAMQAFLTKQINAPAGNGKKYVKFGDKQSPQVNTMKTTLAGPHYPVAIKTEASIVRSEQQNGTLSVEALVEPGFEPGQSSQGFENQISDNGVVDKPKENIRATQGLDAQDELRDWSGKMLPAPLDWETDRASFDNSFMKDYIKGDWEPKVPRGPSVAIETKAKEYQVGVPVGFETPFVSALEQPLTIPDFAQSENVPKQRLQTAAGSTNLRLNAMAKKGAELRDTQKAQESHFIAMASRAPEAHPYAPTIEVYLRPATQDDVKGITDIYNHYVLSPHSIITEDQKAVSADDVAFLIKHTRGEKYPFIVAVKGRMPVGKSKNAKSTLPQFETIIGFGYAETYNYTIGGGMNGRSRFTKNIQFYVHPEYTGKKVGRSILDRLIKSLSHGYGAKDGYDWLNPAEDPIYNPGGLHKCHQIMIQFAVRPNEDPNYQRFKAFLGRYFFEEEGRIRRIARSSLVGPNKPFFADMVFFAKEASGDDEFSPIT